jgi:hypothetical protein
MKLEDLMHDDVSHTMISKIIVRCLPLNFKKSVILSHNVVQISSAMCSKELNDIKPITD